MRSRQYSAVGLLHALRRGLPLQSQMLDFETARGERLILDLDAKEKVRRNRVDWTWKGAPGGLVFEVDRTIE